MPSKSVMPLSDMVELRVSDNMGTYENPLVIAGIEVAKDGGVISLVVFLPSMDVLINTGLVGEDLSYYLR